MWWRRLAWVSVYGTLNSLDLGIWLHDYSPHSHRKYKCFLKKLLQLKLLWILFLIMVNLLRLTAAVAGAPIRFPTWLDTTAVKGRNARSCSVPSDVAHCLNFLSSCIVHFPNCRTPLLPAPRRRIVICRRTGRWFLTSYPFDKVDIFWLFWIWPCSLRWCKVGWCV